MTEARVLPAVPVASLDDYLAQGGGKGIEAASKLGPQGTIDEVTASGLRGRGGAGFPTGRKWQTVATMESPDRPTSVVVNAAEGEPGSFKDRMILRRDPYRVLEGAVIAAYAVDATEIVVAMKETFGPERDRMERAIAETCAAGWFEGGEIKIVAGPSEYLYGEETALLEVVDGRPPFPRVAPPYRHGIDEIGDAFGESAGRMELAAIDGLTEAPPTLVSNTETFANVPGILAHGADWFREMGTADSPGTIVCTVIGATRRHGVGEFEMGTPLAEVIDTLGGGAADGSEIVAVMSGVANPLLPASLLATPLTYEAMRAAGSGLGAAGFIVFDDHDDLVAVAHGVARFLSVESCGQCTPCKQDGMAISAVLDRTRRNEVTDLDITKLRSLLSTVADSARCNLAAQQQLVVGSVLEHFPDAFDAHVHHHHAPSDPYVVAAIVDIVGDRAVLDIEHAKKQPDWTYDETWSGKAPADWIDDRKLFHDPSDT